MTPTARRMPQSRAWSALRRRILTPSLDEASLDNRGFHAKSVAARDLLETIGRTFLTGYARAAEASTPDEVAAALDAVDPVFRGFAYEGAAMGFAIRDGLRTGRRFVDGFLAGPARDHVYMAHVGIGWAMARLPRWRWRRVAPSDPVHRWLAIDGFGFHQAYFQTARYVHRQHRDDAFRWPDNHEAGRYANRAIDQGIGRALWFVAGADGDRVAAMVDTFTPHRHRDLWSGVGLAATYAGGATEQELRGVWDRAGNHRAVVAQGCAFASKARVRAGLVTSDTRLAAAVFCQSSPESAAAVTDAALVDLPVDRDVPSYQIWRQRIADEFATRGRC